MKTLTVAAVFAIALNFAAAAPTIIAAGHHPPRIAQALVPGSLPSYVVKGSDQIVGNLATLTDLSFPVSANARYDIQCRILIAPDPALASDAPLMLYAFLDTPPNPILADISYTDESYGSLHVFNKLDGLLLNGPNSGTLSLKAGSWFGDSRPVTVKAGSFCRYNAY